MSAIKAPPPPLADIEVFSRSQGGWLPGKVEAVTGNEATVVYQPPGVDASKAMKKVVDWPDPEQVRYPAGAPVPAPAAAGAAKPGGGPLDRMMTTGTGAPAAATPAAAPAVAPPAPAPAPAAKTDAGGAGVSPATKIGNSVEVFSDVMQKWVPAVVIARTGQKLTLSYTTEVTLPVRDSSLRELDSGDSSRTEVTASAVAASGGDENAHKIGASGPQDVIDNLPPLEKGIRYHQVRKHGGMGRKGAGESMFVSAGRMGIHLYHMTTGEHFKTYAYEDLKSWEAGPTVLLLEKRQDKGKAGMSTKTVEYETKPGEAMQIVEAIMRQVNNLVQSVKEAAEAAGVDKKERSGSSLTKQYTVKKAGGRGRGKAMKLSCGRKCFILNLCNIILLRSWFATQATV